MYTVENFESFDDYCQKLSNWVNEQRANMYRYYLSSHLMMLNCSYNNQNNVKPSTTQTPPVVSRTNPSSTMETSNDADMPIQGQRYSLPHPIRRMVAELIDYLLLTLIKICIIFFIQGNMSLSKIADNIDLDFRYIINKHRLNFNDDIKNENTETLASGSKTDRENLRQFVNPFEIITMEIIYAEILNRIIITFYEAICLSGILCNISATPGKFIMGISVVSCKDLFDLPANRVEVLPGSLPGFTSALVRSIIKNFAMVFFFPLCMTALIFNHHRTTYDLIAGTLVVKVPPPRQRRLNEAGWAARNPQNPVH